MSGMTTSKHARPRFQPLAHEAGTEPGVALDIAGAAAM